MGKEKIKEQKAKPSGKFVGYLLALGAVGLIAQFMTPKASESSAPQAASTPIQGVQQTRLAPTPTVVPAVVKAAPDPAILEAKKKAAKEKAKVQARYDAEQREIANAKAAKNLEAINNPTIKSNNYFGCPTKDGFKEVADFLRKGDTKAFYDGSAANGCTLLQKGTKVSREKDDFFGGLVRIRIKGEIVSYWTNMEAIQ